MHKGDSICIHCGKSFKDNPRVKEQEYCNRDECQRARRSRWQKEKMRNDADYRDNQKRCWKEWVEKHPGYWEKYRAKNPDYVKRNRELQYIRDARRRKRWRDNVLAKMDSLIKGFYSRRGGVFKILPQGSRLLAKMDSLTVKLIPVQGDRELQGGGLSACKRGLDRPYIQV